ncbi:hypothetical protein ACFL6O_02675 [candidate division KSB1 bacterium]
MTVHRGPIFQLFGRSPADVGKGACNKVFKSCVRLVEAPPDPPCQFCFLRGYLIEPFPCEGRFPHPANGNNVEDGYTVIFSVGDPVGEHFKFSPASDEVLALKQGIRMRDIRLAFFRDSGNVVKITGFLPT